MSEVVIPDPKSTPPTPPAGNPPAGNPPANNQPPTPPTGNVAPVKLAGKYETDEALYEGIRNARKALGLPDLAADKPMVGKGGIYTDVIAAEAAYKDLDSLIGRVKGSSQPPASTTPPDDETPMQALERAGLKGREQELADHWTKNGKLSDAHYQAFKAIGYNRAAADAQVRVHQLESQAVERDAASRRATAERLAGGAEKLGELLEFARTLPDAVRSDLNRRLKDSALIESAITEIMAVRSRSSGAAPSGSLATGTGGGGSTIPQTFAELTALNKRVRAGDPSAIATMKAIPREVLERLNAQAMAF